MDDISDPADDVVTWLNAIFDQGHVADSLLSAAQLARRHMLHDEDSPMALQLSPSSEVEVARQLARDLREERRDVHPGPTRYRADVNDFSHSEELELHAVVVLLCDARPILAIEVVWQGHQWRYHNLNLPEARQHEHWANSPREAYERGRERLKTAQDRAEEGFWSGVSDEEVDLTDNRGNWNPGHSRPSAHQTADAFAPKRREINDGHDNEDDESALRDALQGVFRLWRSTKPIDQDLAERFIRTAAQVAQSP